MSQYDKAILCAGLFFLFVALMSCSTPAKGFTTKNLYETFVREGIIK